MSTAQRSERGVPAGRRERVDTPRSVEREPDRPRAASVDLEIPGYEILGLIHEGAMGAVLKARQISVDRIVAIKVVGEARARDADYVARFCRESLIAAQLLHPNIVATIDAGIARGRPYLVMEYVRGSTLQELLEERGPCDERTAVRVVCDVARALRFLQQRGLSHRDIKPANIILTLEGPAKLADLGLARPLGDESWAVAEAGMAVGTPEYMSPEQTRGQTDLDVRSDLYSLGATLFHLVTGRVPYGGKSIAEAMHRHASARIPLPAPESLNAELTSGLSAIVRKLMARNREDRYRNPDDLIFDLARMLRGARPAIAEFPPEAFAPLAMGEATASGASPPELALPRPGREALTEFPTVAGVAGLPAWMSLLLVSGLTLSLLMTAAAVLILVFD